MIFHEIIGNINEIDDLKEIKPLFEEIVKRYI